MNKGAATRDMILKRAYAIACQSGLEGLSIGDLAAAAGMSKSGVFAHFGSREDLQLAVIDYGAQQFAESVLMPALRAKRGLVRLRKLVACWFDWVRDNRHGCLLMGAVNEYDARPGAQRDRVTETMDRWRNGTSRAVSIAIETHELHADTDARQLAFEILGIALALHQETQLFDPKQARIHADRAFDRLILANLSQPNLSQANLSQINSP